MHLVFDIFQGIGAAAAVGIRPFLPALVVAALAAGNVELHFKHTDYSFLQQTPFLLAMVLGTIVVALLERRFADQLDSRYGAIGLGLISAAIGALLFAGSLARGHYFVGSGSVGRLAWPGLAAGVICAAIGAAATRPLFARVRKRLGGDGGTVPLYAEVTAIVFAALSIVAPPVGVVGLLALVWLLFASRRREGEKYAGLRILK